VNIALKKAHILLPAADVAHEKWAVVACDQFTSQPDYWQKAEDIVGDAPSTLRVTLPEIFLNDEDARIPAIHAAMSDYLNRGVLTEAVHGFVLVERTTRAGVRHGLVVSLDLEAYDYSVGSTSLIRATEGTVPSRVPPRARIRSGAPLELPHVMMLIDDPNATVIEPIYAKRDELRSLYDFELMLDGGHLRGWAVEDDAADAVFASLEALYENCGGLLYAVGDGNHSLAAAKSCWNQIKTTLSTEELENHPARYALVELVNLSCPALEFEAIHRVMFGVDPVSLTKELRAYLLTQGMTEGGSDLVFFSAEEQFGFSSPEHPLKALQAFLDAYLSAHPEVEIDYIHGADALRNLVNDRSDAMGFMPRTFEKPDLFPAVRQWGVLPRKAFSMGEAVEKRYYMESRRIL